MRQMLGLLLGARWRVEMADGGEAARDMALASPPDLVISDVRMPGIDGIELLRALRAAPATHDVPVILVSARAGERETIAGLEAGADDFLIKPFSGARADGARAGAPGRHRHAAPQHTPG